MHIEIAEHRPTGYEVRVVDSDGITVRMFIYSTIEAARRAARAWRVAHGDCPIDDKTGLTE
jgi:hypothetical protein